MIITSLATLMTAGDLWELPDDGTLYELSQGKLIRMSRSAYGPSKISGRVLVRIGSFVDQHNLGDYGTAEGGFRLESDPDTVRAPDVWFVRAENAPREPPERGFWRGRPDLAVEVLSPSDRFEQVMRKVRDYLAAGVPLVWAFDSEVRCCGVFSPGALVSFVEADGVLDGEDVLPGFTLPVRDVLP